MDSWRNCSLCIYWKIEGNYKPHVQLGIMTLFGNKFLITLCIATITYSLGANMLNKFNRVSEICIAAKPGIGVNIQNTKYVTTIKILGLGYLNFFQLGPNLI